jgi:predicted transcriptional regulator
MKTWEQARQDITSISDAEKQEIRQMAQLVSRIIERRQAFGLTQKQLADRAGLKQAAVARLESATTMPRVDTLLRVSNSLNLQLSLTAR